MYILLYIFIVFDENKELQKEMISRKDIRGNTPVMLCTILHSIKNEQIFIEILSLLLKNNADFKKKNIFEKSPLDVAGANTDKEIVELLYESYCKRQKEKMDRNCREVSLYFSTMKDFYVEMNWEVHIPILSFLCPKDTCKVWKKGSNLRMDTTFVTFKNLSSVRGNLSFMLMNNNDRINTFKFNRDKKIYFDMFEPLDSEEKKLIIKEILDKKRVNGSFKILKCQLHESLSFFGKKKIYETVNGWPTQKFEIDLTVSMDIFPNEKIVFDDINEDNYLNSNINIIKERTIVGDHKEFKKKLLEGGGLNNDKLIHSEKEKQLKAYVWIVDKSPIKSKDMVNLINSIASVNEVTQKLKDFLNHPDVVEIINNNGFPIKIQIPYNIFINFTIHFNNYKEYSDPNDKDISDKFDIINQCQRVARKIEQNVMKDEKMRLKYANIR